jgi:excisionase family DNA binding protein
MHPELLTVEAAAQLLMVGRATAYAWARDGRLPVVRVNGLIRVPRAALMQWIEAQSRGLGPLSHTAAIASPANDDDLDSGDEVVLARQ